MKNKKLILAEILVLLFIYLFLAGCPVTPDHPPENETPDNPVVEENSSLFSKDDTSGIISFETNDTKYSGQYGYTLWTQEDEVHNPFTHLNVTLSKISGNSDAGYGVVFCSYEDTMLVVLINTKREFIIGELTGNVFTVLQSWSEAPSLNEGWNQTNTIDITLNSGEFSMTFNSGDPVVFMDSDEPSHSYGKDGYMVVISPLDDFPNIPVSVTFKKN